MAQYNLWRHIICGTTEAVEAPGTTAEAVEAPATTITGKRTRDLNREAAFAALARVPGEAVLAIDTAMRKPDDDDDAVATAGAQYNFGTIQFVAQYKLWYSMIYGPI